MKRYIEINEKIDLKKYNSSEWELIIKINQQEIVPFYMELQLLDKNLIESFTVKSLVSKKYACFKMINDSDISNIDIKNERYLVELTHLDILDISSF